MDRTQFFRGLADEFPALALPAANGTADRTRSDGVPSGAGLTNEHYRRMLAEAESVLRAYRPELERLGFSATFTLRRGEVSLAFRLVGRPLHTVFLLANAPEEEEEYWAGACTAEGDLTSLTYTDPGGLATTRRGLARFTYYENGPPTNAGWTAAAFEAYLRGQILSYLRRPLEAPEIEPLPPSRVIVTDRRREAGGGDIITRAEGE